MAQNRHPTAKSTRKANRSKHLPIIPNIPGPETLPQATPVVAEKRAVARSAIFLTFGILLLFALGWKILKELEIIYVAALMAVVLMPVVSAISSVSIRGWKPSRPIAIIVLLFGTLLFLTLFFWIGLPPVMRDLRGFLTDLPARIPGVVARVKHLPMGDKFGLDQIATKAENMAGAIGAYLFSSIPEWLSHLFDILTTVFLCIYFMLEGEHAYNFFLTLFPLTERRRLDMTLRKAEHKMSKWLLGQGLLMLIMGCTFLIVLGLLHVRYFILLGVLFGLFNIIPVAGGVLSVLLAAVAAALDSWTKMFGVFIAYAIYVNVENAVLTPRIMKSSVDLMGLTVLISLLIGTALAGVVGALVAVPTAALISVLLDEYAVKR